MSRRDDGSRVIARDLSINRGLSSLSGVCREEEEQVNYQEYLIK